VVVVVMVVVVVKGEPTRSRHIYLALQGWLSQAP
jgi:hypothetical protein